MDEVGAPAPRRRRVAREGRPSFPTGGVIASAWDILRRHAWPYLSLAALLQVPLTALSFHEGPWSRIPQAFTFTSGEVVGALVLQSVVAHGTYRELSGQPVGVVGALAGLRRLPSVVGVAVTNLLATWGILIVAGVLGLSTGSWGLVAYLVLGLALVVSLQCAWFVAVQVAVVEPVRPDQALARSAWLTAGSRWRILGIVLGVTVIPYAFSFLAYSAGRSEIATSLFGHLVLGVYVLDAIRAGITAFGAVVATVAYYALRRQREGIGRGQILRVFD